MPAFRLRSTLPVTLLLTAIAGFAPAQQTAAPTFSPTAGTYTSVPSVRLKSTTPNATIFYTLDGCTPTVNSRIYTAPIPVTAGTTIKAIAIGRGESAVSTATYIIHTGAGIISTAADGLIIPVGGTTDASGNLYVVESGNQVIRKITPTGTISTVAGVPYTPGYVDPGDGVPATRAVLHSPSDVKFDPKGNMYIPDSGIYSGNDSGITYHGDCVIREVSPAGIISTPMGTSGPCGYSGDGGPASAATLNAPQGIAFDAAGNLYIADSGNNVIRKVTPSGTISTVAGNGVAGFAGDGGPATAAQFNGPSDVTLDSAGSLYIADSYNYRIRKVTPEGVISTVVDEGSGVCPTALAADNNDSIYFADSCESSLVRKVTASGSVTTVAGKGTYGFAGDGGLATAAELADPGGLFVDRNQDLYISDSGNDRIRKVTFPEAKHDPAPRQVLNITAAKVRVVAGAPATLRLDQLLSSYSAPGLTRTQLQAALADVEVGVTIAADGHSYKFHLWSYGSYDGNQRMDTLAAPDRRGTYTITPYITGAGASHFTLNETPGTLTIVAR